MKRDLAPLVERLCQVSAARPQPSIAWPARLAREQWCFSPELLSLHGTAAYDGLPDAARRRLSFHEAVSFFSLNLHGERFLIAGLIERAAAPDWRALAPYLDQFRADEERHSAYFGEFCQRYAGKTYRDHGAAAPRTPMRAASAPGEVDVLFFARVLIFEEIADAYNRHMAADERLARLVRQINRLHHLDETRHLAFGRALVPALLAQHAGAWDEETLARVRTTLEGFLTATWRAYYNPDVYRDAGLAATYELREEAFAAGANRRRAVGARCRWDGLVEHRLLSRARAPHGAPLRPRAERHIP